MHRKVVAFGCLLAALSVALGAFGSHGLKPYLNEYGTELYRTAIQYLMFHAVGVLVTGLASPSRAVGLATIFGLGALFFSGSLIGLALGGPRWLGAVAPIGGTLFISAWLVLGWRVVKAQ